MSENPATPGNGKEKKTRKTRIVFVYEAGIVIPNAGNTNIYDSEGNCIAQQHPSGDRVRYDYTNGSSGNDSDDPIIVQPPPDK
jgi:hypothetical protein